MERAYGLELPRTLEEACNPQRTALIVYDMQVGVLSQIATGDEITARVGEVLGAARAGGYRVFFTRHLSLPKECMGAFQLRQAMAWQRVDSAAQVRPWFAPDAPATQIAPQLTPLSSEAVVDKIMMSAFTGTYLDIALRDCGLSSFVIVGVALEIGIEPTVRHSTDLGYLPVVVTDACGGRDAAAMERARRAGVHRRRLAHRCLDHLHSVPPNTGREDSEAMSGAINILHPDRPKRVLILASNPAVSPQTGWPIGFWWAELSHPYWEFTEGGYQVDIASPDGGPLQADSWSDPRDPSGYSASNLLSLGFLQSPPLMSKISASLPLGSLKLDAYDALFLVGGQGPMYTFYADTRVHRAVSDFYQTGKATAIVCHATCVLLKATLSDGTLLVNGKSWTGFANSEEQYADKYVGKKIQPFWIEDEARKLPGTSFLVQGRFKAHAVRDGNLITGQQQYSGAAAARLVIQALGL